MDDDHLITVELSDEEWATVERLAAETGETVADMVERFTREWCQAVIAGGAHHN